MATPLKQKDPYAGIDLPTGNVGVGMGNFPGPAMPQSLQPAFQLQNPATPLAPAGRSNSSIPLPGQDSLPDDFEQLKQQIGLTQKQEPGLLAKMGKGIADIALQPARALEQVGKFFGTLGLSPEQKKKVDAYLGPGLQEQVLGSDYATPTPETGKQATGIALKAAANLSTPFANGLPSMALQGAAYEAGDALEQNKSLPEVALSAGIGGASSAALGAILNGVGSVVGRGFKAAAPELQKMFKPVADKLGPMFTGTSRKEFDMAFKESPHVLMDYLNVLRDAQTPAEAEGLLRGRLVEGVRSVADKAKQVEGKAFQSAIDTFNQNFPDVTVDIPAAAKKVLEEYPKFGRPRNADEKFALDGVLEIIREPRQHNVDGTRTLLQDLWSFADGLEPGSPAERLAKQAWGDVREELSRATSAVDGGAFNKAMDRYATFKGHMDELNPAISSKTKEDTARSFVANLAGSNKTAARESLQVLEKTAGIDDAVNSVEMYRLLKRLAAEGKVTGSRVQDIFLSGGMVSGLGAIGSLFGPAGTAAGTMLGSLLAAKTLAPSTITSIMLSELKAAKVPITSEIRRFLQQAITNPATRQSIINATMGGQKQPPQ